MPVIIKRVVICCFLSVFYCAIKQYFVFRKESIQ